MKRIDREFTKGKYKYYHRAGDPKYHKVEISNLSNDIVIERSEFLMAVKQIVAN